MKKLLIILILPALLFLSCEKELSVTPDDQLSTNIKIFVDSNPQGAQIFINDLNMGQRTPDIVEWVEPGKHELKLTLDLYKDTSLIIDITEGKIDSFYLDYNSNPSMLGRISVNSEPRGADIYLDGEYTSFKTPRVLGNIIPGKHEIKLKLEGYWDLTVEETIVTGRTSYIDRKLSDTLIWVNFNMATVDLPTDYINAVAVQKGYIKWFGTAGQGLVRFDGNEWKIFNTSNSPLPSDIIKTIEAKNDDVWIGTDNGAAHYNNGNWKIYDMSNSPLQTNIIECFFIDHLNRVWIGSYNKGVYVLDGGGWTMYNRNNTPLPTDFIQSIYVQENGNFWIGTNRSGLVQFDGTDWRITTFLLPKSKSIEEIYIDDLSNVWIGCNQSSDSLIGGIGVRKNNFWESFYNFGTDVKDLAVDQQKNIWFASYDFGLVKYSNAWKVYNTFNSRLISERINGIAIDGEGNKWISTFGAGVIKYKGD